ncbi:MAG TPA: LytTR family DNA-binding domain-containing protein [Puia sp.]|nr:LytTR family DNA-binding domain-containing protein [Puia sp.]
MTRAIIIDDEQNNIDNLIKLLQKYCPDVIISAAAMNADDGRKIIIEQKPDLIFLDIQMPGKNGFDLLKSLSNHDFEIIFVTAFDKYGIQAVKFAAIDYLLKPINIEELKQAVNKAIGKTKQKKQNLQLENLLQLLQETQQKQEHRIALPTAKEIRFARTEDIIRCESSNNYTSFFLASGEKLIVSKPIYEYEELLSDYGFIRCHQSHLVNKKFIKSLLKEDGGFLLLEDNSQIPVSRQKKDYIKTLLAKIK